MKTKAKLSKVSTWLPIFSGFYQTIWDDDNLEEMEIEYINEQRKEKGLEAIGYDDIDWNYKQYSKDVVNGVTEYVGDELKKMGLISSDKLEKLSSPREYNFANDSIHVQFSLTEANKEQISKYLIDNKEAFTKYIEDKYTSYDGFYSSYSNNVEVWLVDLKYVLEHTHKLGSVLQFILENEGELTELDIYEDMRCNGLTIEAILKEAK